MKIAQTFEGQPIEASVTAPKEAVCPCCGGRLLLRARKLMGDGQRVYYWRHQGNRNRDCSARKRPGG
jgi:DNA-directed RNA polymerase subunit RPC12/RpoP